MECKFLGCLIGGLVGDCLGSPFESYRFPTIPTNLDTLIPFIQNLETNDNSSKKQEMFSYTDDTAMMKSVALWLLESESDSSFDTKRLAKLFAEEYFREPKRGYGEAIRGVFRSWRGSNYENVNSAAWGVFDGAGSMGNGGGMRVGPIPLYAHAKQLSMDEMVNIVRNSSMTTHTHPHGYNGGILQAIVIKKALETELKIGEQLDISKFIKEVADIMEPIEKNSPDAVKVKGNPFREERMKKAILGDTETKTPYTDKLMEIKTLLESDEEPTVDDIVTRFGNWETAPRSIPTAIYCALRAVKGEIPRYQSDNPMSRFLYLALRALKGKIPEFRSDNPMSRCLFLALSLSGDTDTIGCMACSIVGAFYGEEVIPVGMKNNCEDYAVIKELATRLFQLKKHN